MSSLCGMGIHVQVNNFSSKTQGPETCCYFIKDTLSIKDERSKVKVGVLRPSQQPGSYWDRSSELPLVGLEPTEVTAYD